MAVLTLPPRVVAAAHGPTYRIGLELVTFKAVAAETGGAYSLFEALTPPHSGMPPHLQHYEDKGIFVLEGAVTLLVAGATHELREGDYAFVPRGSVHSLSNGGPAAARLLIMITPGGIHELFLAEVGELIPDPRHPPPPAGPPDPHRLVAVAARYGIEVLPRPDT